MRATITTGLMVLATGCGTLADHGGGQTALPNAGAGPFRALAAGEIGGSRVPPYALKSDSSFPRDAALLDLDGDPATLEVWAYVARSDDSAGLEPVPSGPSDQIVRHVSFDGRTLNRQLEVVLQPALAWEGGTIGAPAVLDVDGGDIWLYYGAAGGIGLATSSDGVSFTRAGEVPVLGPEPTGWEGGAVPESPAVLRLPDGRYQMFYQVALPAGGSAIGEALSDDGRSWQRVGSEPALAPRDAAASEPSAIYDDVAVGSPMALLVTAAAGRQIERLYYGATAGDGRRSVGLAARFGIDGAFERAASPVFGSSGSLGPAEPWVIAFEGFSLLFCTERAGRSEAQDYPAVAVGVAPATATLPPPIDP